ncbi:MAG: hypothetical protein WC694_00955 [Candidatus Paceibacterota bacterium]|jgi:hypothetical protein
MQKGKKAKAKAKDKDFKDDDCEICKLMRNGNPTPEALEKAFNLQNFLNNFPKDKGKKK